MATRMKQRRGTAAEWAAANEVLGEGEVGFEEDTLILKIGDGVTAWNDLLPGHYTRDEANATFSLIHTHPFAADDHTHTPSAHAHDEKLDKTGGTMTGALTLVEPTAVGHAARLKDANPTLRVVRSNKDAEGVWTTIDWYRADATKHSRSVLSGGSSPLYTTRTVTTYADDGATVLDSAIYTLSYDVDGDFQSEVFA